MSDKPIIFSAPMVLALLDGRKTQTRRVLKAQPVARDVRPNGFFGITNAFSFTLCDDGGANSTMAVPVGYQVGDRLYVREHWCTHRAYDDMAPRDLGGDEPVRYAADGHTETWGWPPMEIPGRFRQGMHMPRWASRLTLIVTDVRVQRLQDISEADARREGLQSRMDWCPQYRGADELPWRSEFPRAAFRDLWNSIHGPNAWDANPWVCALTFTVHRCNIDQMEPAHA